MSRRKRWHQWVREQEDLVNRKSNIEKNKDRDPTTVKDPFSKGNKLSEHPSYKIIPTFFSSRESEVNPAIRRAARHRMCQRKALETLEENDLVRILNYLQSNAVNDVLDFKTFQKIPQQLLVDNKYSSGRKDDNNKGVVEEDNININNRFVRVVDDPLFSTRTFLKFTSLVGEIGIVPFFSYLVRKINIKQTRIQLTYYDTVGNGYLREKDVENYIFELIPTLSALDTLQPEFHPFFVFTAVRRFFFFLDSKRTGKIYIRHTLPSTILPELYELRGPQITKHTDLVQTNNSNRRQDHAGDGDLGSNWFSVESALRVYGLYLELDTDQNGMLCFNELSKVGSGMLTYEILDQVFTQTQTYRDEHGSQELDYKGFLDFCLAWRSKNSKQSIEYFFKFLDIKKNGKLDPSVIKYFIKGIIRTLEEHQLDKGLAPETIVDEIFDIIRPKNPNFICLEDILSSKMGQTVISILTDAQAFYNYDNRETLMHSEEEDED